MTHEVFTDLTRCSYITRARVCAAIHTYALLYLCSGLGAGAGIECI